jgi:hypothetical protein
MARTKGSKNAKITKEQKAAAANIAMIEAGKALKKAGKKIPAAAPKAKAQKEVVKKPVVKEIVESPVIAKVREMCEAKKLSALTTKDACSRVRALMAKYSEPPTDEQLKSDITVMKKNNALWALRLWRAALGPQA